MPRVFKGGATTSRRDAPPERRCTNDEDRPLGLQLGRIVPGGAALPPDLPEPPRDGQHRETDRPGLCAADQRGRAQRGRAIGATPMGVREPHVVRLPPVGLKIGPVPSCPPRRRSRRAGLVRIRECRRARPTALGAADPGCFPLLDMDVGRLGSRCASGVHNRGRRSGRATPRTARPFQARTHCP